VSRGCTFRPASQGNWGPCGKHFRSGQSSYGLCCGVELRRRARGEVRGFSTSRFHWRMRVPSLVGKAACSHARPSRRTHPDTAAVTAGGNRDGVAGFIWNEMGRLARRLNGACMQLACDLIFAAGVRALRNSQLDSALQLPRWLAHVPEDGPIQIIC
jgi:hypothetical protein